MRDKEGALENEVKELKQKIEDLNSDIWWKENIDELPADQLAPLQPDLANFQAQLPDVEARVANEREPLRAA